MTLIKGWGIADIWSAGFAAQDKRPIEPRERIWASELGKAPIEVYLKMKGIAPSNEPNDRAKMKMEAGTVVEGVVKSVLKRAGILRGTQIEAKYQYENYPVVSGKPDFLAGGKIDLQAAYKYMAILSDISPSLERAALKTIEYLSEKYPDGLPEQLFEIKSIATFGMDAMEITKKPLKLHRLQLMHYIMSLGYEYGTLTYICRDDYRMMEFCVEKTPEAIEEYHQAIAEIGKYIVKDEEPPKAPLITFDMELGKFSKNLNVEWSNYLTMLYDFKEPREYSEIYGRKATSWNGVLKRIHDGKDMTAKNLAYIEEMKEMGYDANVLALQWRGISSEEEEA